jgi:hypothetical protein
MKLDHVGGASADVPAPANGAAGHTTEDPRARILSRYAVVESGDYFQVLDLPREATAADVERAHARLAREIEPDAVGSDLASELRAQIEAIREVAGEALRILKDERLRTRYRAHLPS